MSSNRHVNVAYDFSRFVKYLKRKYPSGIERVDINYLHGLVSDETVSVHGVLELPSNVGRAIVKIPNNIMIEIYHHLFGRWILNDISDEDFDRSAAIITAKINEHIKKVKIDPHTGCDVEILALQYTETDCVYVNVCFFDIKDGPNHTRLIRNMKFRPFYVVHDLIGIEFPEYCSKDVPARQLNAIVALAQLNPVIIAISEHVKEKIEAVFAALKFNKPNIVVNMSGITEKFTKNINEDKNKDKLNQFVFVSTIEPRKNHAFLLNVWKKFINTVPNEEIPKLILIGRRGWSNQVVFDALDLNFSLKNFIIEKNNATDDELIFDLCNSKATLFPSFDEGWGLPIVESLALGTPVICSDIPVHHECSQEKAVFLDPIDGLGWYKTILDVTRGDLKLSAAGFSPVTWEASVAGMRKILEEPFGLN